jgi:hypothetical protein
MAGDCRRYGLEGSGECFQSANRIKAVPLSWLIGWSGKLMELGEKDVWC